MLQVDFATLGLLGLIEIDIYYNKTFSLGKNKVPIYVHDLNSLKELAVLFYNTPFSISIDKIEYLDFHYYEIEIDTIKVESFEILINSLAELVECLYEVLYFNKTTLKYLEK